MRRFDAERAHQIAFTAIRLASAVGLGALLRRYTRPPDGLGVDALGMHFESPFGLAAGFDKNATGLLGLWQLGFGHIEAGTVTAIPQPGNDRPRLFRLLADRALVNRMGFNNAGAAAAARRIRRLAATSERPVVGVNIGKSRVVAVENAIEDYRSSAAAVAGVADYLVVNVSSPNTPGLRGLQEIDRLEPLLAAVREVCGRTPLLVKIAPDLADGQIAAVAALAVRLGLDGIIATNTTIGRDGLAASPEVVAAAGAGGLSGAPLAQRSLRVLELLRSQVPAELCIISVGGVETAQDVADRLNAGATLVQGYSGFIYRGPFWAREITHGLSRLLRR